MNEFKTVAFRGFEKQVRNAGLTQSAVIGEAIGNSLAEAWFCSGFPEHTTTKTNLPGYVCLRTAPHPAEGEKPQDQLLKFTARQVAELVAKAPGKSIGILCRRNDVVARLIYELRELKVEASEEGGSQPGERRDV